MGAPLYSGMPCAQEYLEAADHNRCTCYVTHNLNTGKDENTLSRTCPVHLVEATAFYAEYDRNCETRYAETLRDRALKERRCPRCHVGIDDEGDGDCAVCAPWTEVEADRVRIRFDSAEEKRSR